MSLLVTDISLALCKCANRCVAPDARREEISTTDRFHRSLPATVIEARSDAPALPPWHRRLGRKRHGAVLRRLLLVTVTVGMSLTLLGSAHAASNWQTNAPSLNVARDNVASASGPCPATTPGTPSTSTCLYTIGGFDGGATVSSVEYYDPSTGTTGSWQTNAPSLNTARRNLGVVTAPCPATTPGTPSTKTCLYAIAGDDITYMSSVEYYDPSTGTTGSWQTNAPSLNTARYLLGAASAPCPAATPGTPSTKTCLYAIGGFGLTAAYASSVEYYDPSTGTTGSWQTNAPSLNTGRNDLGAATAPCPAVTPGTPSTRTCLYAVGGIGVSGYLSSVEYYDPSIGTTGSWQTNAPSLTAAREGLGVATAPCPAISLGTPSTRTCLYAVGGSNGAAYLSISEYYDPSTGTTGSWHTSDASLSVGRAYIGAATAPCPATTPGTPSTHTCPYVMGGTNGRGYLNSVEYYDPTTDPTLSLLHSAGLTRHGAQVTFHWTVASNQGIAGFFLTAHGARFNHDQIAVHSSHRYRFTVSHLGPGPYMMRTILDTGQQVTTAIG